MIVDTPPADHGSDRYDYIEVEAPVGVDPPATLTNRLLVACLDCRANVFLRWLGGDPAADSSWNVTVAHDDGCGSYPDLP